MSNRLRQVLVDSPGSLGERARTHRWEMTATCFPDFEDLDILDLGGTVEAWLRAPLRPRHVTVLNLLEPGTSNADWITPVLGDACNAEAVLDSEVSRSRFDLVYSNAVLEHVGGHARREQFAAAARRMAPRHWIQTPYRYFPVEPHWLFPGMQFLPVAARARVAQLWPLGHTPPNSYEAARSSVLWTELVGLTEMREYFPDSTLLKERMAGLTKSVIAVRAVE